MPSVATPVRLGRPAFAWSPSPDAVALSLPEQIAECVGNAIIGGELQPGDRVHEQTLSSQYAVSRGPVREALRILERDGLIQINARRGARVTALAADEVEAVFELRSALLGVAAARVARQPANPGVVAGLRERIGRLPALARAAEPDGYVSAVYEINLMLVDACGNRFLRGFFFSLAHRTLRYSRLGLATPTRRLLSARRWKRLCTAIEAGDVAGARALGETLVSESRDHAIAQLATPRPAAADTTPASRGRTASRGPLATRLMPASRGEAR